MFHMPGHKLGRGFILGDTINHEFVSLHKLGRGFMPGGAFNNPALFDVTELDVTDDLHSPRGPLREAQELAARAFGAGRTWFLVNGSSCGIFAMIAAVCGGDCFAGRKLLIARDFHYSAYNAMMFARIKPIYITTQNNGALCPESVENALIMHPDAAALFLTRPGYYGNISNIVEIASLARERGIPVLVDEAHGAHFAFSGRLPVSALEGGADICVQSAHKTLPAFTQCAYLHISERALSGIDGIEGRISEALRAFQTSSPSFLLAASLDYAREYMAERGAAELDRVLDFCESFYTDMGALGYGIPADIWPAPAGAGRYARDMTRLVLDTRPLGLSGGEVERLLWSRYKIKIEMSDPGHIIMIATVADRDDDFEALSTALAEIANNRSAATATMTAAPTKQGAAHDVKQNCHITSESIYPDVGMSDARMPDAEMPDAVMPLDFMSNLHAPRIFLPLETSEGRDAADIIAPYPPGIPLLCPGEKITHETIKKIQSLLQAGYIIKGINADDMTIAVHGDPTES